MRKLIPVILLFILLVSCSEPEVKRQVCIEIPEHPWEIHTGESLWYYLKYGSSSDDLQTLYISSEEREVILNVPKGKTVYFCAYPLGEMQCFGSAICPQDDSYYVYLNANEGYLANLLLNTQGDAASKVNFPLLCQLVSQLVSNFRTIDGTQLVKDMLNGVLSKSSLRESKLVTVSPFAISNGKWISEILEYGSFSVTQSISPEFNLPSGIYRYLNYESELELRIVVEESGAVFYHIRSSLL